MNTASICGRCPGGRACFLPSQEASGSESLRPRYAACVGQQSKGDTQWSKHCDINKTFAPL